MKGENKSVAHKVNDIVVSTDNEIEKLCADSVELIHFARNAASKQVNTIQIMTYYSLGKWIVETRQMGKRRAKYGSQVIKRLSEKLQKEFEKGFSEDTLKNARKFYLTYKDRISETVFSLFAIEKSETVFSFFQDKQPFIVSWSHQMYVNYYDRYQKLEDENPTIGILLCKEKNDALVEITLPKDANIYASEYKLYLPDKKLLQQKLREWIAEEDE